MENFSRIFPQYGKLFPIFPRYGKLFGKFSTVWKTFFHGVENSREGAAAAASRGGAALIVALWTVLILSLLVSGLAYEMHIQSGITSYARKRLKAQVASRGGAEYAKFLLAKSFETSAFEEEDLEKESFRILSKNLERGIGVSGIEVEMGGSTATVDILPEAGRRNVNLLQDEDWEELLDQAGVPEEIWPELIDCFMDFTDENDAHRLHGAEADDPFYKSAGYEPKNAPLDTVDELLLIKGFTPEIVYGGPPADPRGEPLRGIAHLLTTFGDGKVNVNTASREVLLTLTAGGQTLTDFEVDDILRYRLGDDGLPNTKDDGYLTKQEVISKAGINPAFADKISVSDRLFVRVVSIGDNNGVRMGVWAVFEVGKNLITPIYWREEQMQ
jgi:general secretion pathway protein K